MSYIQVQKYLLTIFPSVLTNIILCYSNEYIDKYNKILNVFKQLISINRPELPIFLTIHEYNIQREYNRPFKKRPKKFNINSIIRVHCCFLYHNKHTDINFLNDPTLNSKMNRLNVLFIITKIENNNTFYKRIKPNSIKSFYKSCIALYDTDNIQTEENEYCLSDFNMIDYIANVIVPKKFYLIYDYNYDNHYDYRDHNKYYP